MHLNPSSVSLVVAEPEITGRPPCCRCRKPGSSAGVQVPDHARDLGIDQFCATVVADLGRPGRSATARTRVLPSILSLAAFASSSEARPFRCPSQVGIAGQRSDWPI